MKTVDYKKILDLYNEMLAGESFVPCHTLTDRRKELIDRFARRWGEDQFPLFFERMKQATDRFGIGITFSEVLSTTSQDYLMNWAPTLEIAKDRLASFMEDAEQWEIEKLLIEARRALSAITFLPLRNWVKIFGHRWINKVEFERCGRTGKIQYVYIDGVKNEIVKVDGSNG